VPLGELLGVVGSCGRRDVSVKKGCSLPSVGVLTRKCLAPQHRCTAILDLVEWSVGSQSSKLLSPRSWINVATLKMKPSKP
jgi:hypothetical protein